MWLLALFKNLFFILLFLFIFIVLAGCLFSLSKYLEENPNRAQKPIIFIIYVSALLHIYLYVIKVPLIYITSSILVHILYGIFLQDYPYLKAKDRNFIVPTAIACINHFHLVYITNISNYGFKIISAFILNWTVPFLVFFCVSANQENIDLSGSARKNSLKIANFLEKAFKSDKTTISKS